jgi:uncharacterized protein YifE (UPF0438 family)
MSIEDNSPFIAVKLQKLLNKSQSKLLVEKLLIGNAMLVVYVVLQPQILLEYHWLLDGLFYLSLFLGVALPFAKQRKRLNEVNLTEHFNRQVPQLEESMQLLVNPSAKFSVLQRLQKDRISHVFIKLHAQGVFDKALLPIRFKFTLSLLLVAGIIWIAGYVFDKQQPITTAEHQVVLEEPAPVKLLSTIITVTPPKYTGLASATFTQGDIEVLEGSTVQWQMNFSAADGEYFLLFAGKTPIPLVKDINSESFSVSAVINKTAIYRIIDGKDSDFPSVYSIAVNQDQKPKVRIIKPDKPLLELAKSSDATLMIKALVNDDFTVTKVEIIASVAKGSGESVKFRDEVFTFDSKLEVEQGQLYTKAWDLKALGMEPGDEVYFSVVATDNKQEKAQQGRSGTVIVRWLDEASQIITAQGVMLNFAAEYFRSQRQIIIETEQLIADKNALNSIKFNELSVLLGHSQSDLKQRYGQYLGDEFGDGAGNQLDASMDDHEADEHQHQQPDAHGDQSDKSGESQILAQYAHAHEEVHVGEVSPQNPKAMMKKSVSFMWQAQLHLMLSEPELALSFEKQAYKYLKLAKQAERIYVKRLGFEPPPVSEDKRLTGDLKDIKSYSIASQSPSSSSNDDELFRTAFSLLNQLKEQAVFSPTERQQLNTTKARLTALAQTRPNLIRQAATIERMLIANSTLLTDCQGCNVQLKQKLWQLISTSISRPVTGQQQYFDKSLAIADYLMQIQGEHQ